MATQEEFNCEFCGQTFLTDADLTKHMDQMHPDKEKETIF